MGPRRVKRYISDANKPMDFWESLVYLERQDAFHRYCVYFVLSFVVYGAPAIAAAIVGMYRGFTFSGQTKPISELLVGVNSSVLQLFAHNSLIVLAIFFGFLTIGIISIIVLMLNGMFVGYGIGYITGAYGLGYSLAAIAPHGIFELPALWIAGVASLRMIHMISMFSVSAREKLHVEPWEFVITTRKITEVAVVLAISITLVAIASIVEVHVTPWVVEIVAG